MRGLRSPGRGERSAGDGRLMRPGAEILVTPTGEAVDRRRRTGEAWARMTDEPMMKPGISAAISMPAVFRSGGIAGRVGAGR